VLVGDVEVRVGRGWISGVVDLFILHRLDLLGGHPVDLFHRPIVFHRLEHDEVTQPGERLFFMRVDRAGEIDARAGAA
jgi:hypothetical protein